MYNSFDEMPVWQKSMEISIDVFKISLDLPRSEDYGLTSQIRRSSNSVSSNVAEAFGRSSKKDKKNFYIYSRASAFETINHLIYGNKVGYFINDDIDKLIRDFKIIIFELNKIIKALE